MHGARMILAKAAELKKIIINCVRRRADSISICPLNRSVV